MGTLAEAGIWLWTWCKGNPWTVLLVAYAILNILYAQLPKPKNPKLLRIWEFTHWALQIVVTNAKDAGTFTWPGILRSALGALAGVPADGFVRTELPTNPGTPVAKKDSLPPTVEELPTHEEGKLEP